MELQKPDTQTADYTSKFVRFGKKIHVTTPGDIKTSHYDLVQQDGLVPTMYGLLREGKSLEIDGGFIRYEKNENSIAFYGQSGSIGAPEVPAARLMTGVVAKPLLPEQTIFCREEDIY